MVSMVRSLPEHERKHAHHPTTGTSSALTPTTPTITFNHKPFGCPFTNPCKPGNAIVPRALSMRSIHASAHGKASDRHDDELTCRVIVASTSPVGTPSHTDAICWLFHAPPDVPKSCITCTGVPSHSSSTTTNLSVTPANAPVGAGTYSDNP